MFSAVRLVLTILATLHIVAGQNLLHNTYSLCCAKGEEYIREGKPCGVTKGPIPGIPVEQQSICLSAIGICCSKARAEQQCSAGLEVAREGKACSSEIDSGIDFNKDCCEACKLGLLASSFGSGCDPNVFGLLPPSDKPFAKCCEIIPTVPSIPNTVSTYTNRSLPSPPQLNGLCEKYPNQLCEHICLDEPGSYHCECNPGYTLLPDKKTCRRTEAGGDEVPKFVSTTDRCDENNPCEHHCIDTGVSIRCTCDSGFELANDKTTCNDIDECELGLSNCDPYTEECHNLIGSFQCDLKSSYIDNGDFPTNDLSDNPCPKGYIFDNIKQVCDDVDECAQGLDDCNRESQDCLNTYGNFTCQNKVSKKTCPPGFKRNTILGTCEDINECADNNPCAANEICNNVSGGYQCDPSSTAVPLENPLGLVIPSPNNPPSRLPPKFVREPPTNPPPSRRPYYPQPLSRRTETTTIPTTTTEEVTELEEIPITTLSTTAEPYTSRPYAGTPQVSSQRQTPEDVEGTQPNQPRTSPVLTPNRQNTCESGYRMDRRGYCIDINECYEETHDCDSNQDCYNTRGSYDCRCKIGFQLNPITGACVDINECQANKIQCAPTQRCDNTIGSYRCTRVQGCGTGYTLNDANDDECALNTHNCHILGPNYQCKNTLGSFRCVRKPRVYYITTRNPQSTPVFTSSNTPNTPNTPNAPIAPNTVIPLQRVSSRPYTSPPEQPRDRYTDSPTTNIQVMPSKKTCFPGYRLNAWNQCEDINECAEQRVCKHNERCINYDGGFRCEAPQCPSGKQLNPEGTRCVDIDECALGIHKCGSNEKCINKDGGYLCQCLPGHMLKGDRCEDIDECERFKGRTCAQNSICENTVGSFRCTCKEGFKSVSDTVCEDVNECHETVGLCEHTCINSWGTYRCACRQGFELNSDNRTCTDIDECTEFKDMKLCMGSCVNTPGSYVCRCPPGYRLASNGRSCIDIDECESTSTCRADEICLNMRGSYRCRALVCPPGYRKHPTVTHRCQRDEIANPCYDTQCQKMAHTISFNYITIPSLLPVPPEVGFIDIFRMRGPHWTNFGVKFNLNLESVESLYSHVQPIDISYFELRQDKYNAAVVGMVKSIEGPQDIQLSVQMTIYLNDEIQSIAIAKLYVFVAEYSF
ncbi:fibulin-2-like isoform X2 [Chrysoperla carnea]|uniref:fibulin-2-like isoform X2 n=1 Tax=Chrysoperla carnea TaxID=189513 RepID=UPI001D07FD0C|nr:fibulin-2-like isoform X2 [Chrysoperla carnea]